MDTQSLPLVPFGKHRGKPITTLINDTKYFEWCKQQAWLQKYEVVYNICVNQTITTNNTNSKTPEHNKLQNKFLDEPTQIKLLDILKVGNGGTFYRNFKLLISDEEFVNHFGKWKMPQINRSLEYSKIVFEEKYNWDFILHYSDDQQTILLKKKTDTNTISREDYDNYYKDYDEDYDEDPVLTVVLDILRRYNFVCGKNMMRDEGDNEKYKYSFWIDIIRTSCNVCCELKPVLSDDYPCVLRKIKNQIELTENDMNYKRKNNIFILIIGSFTSINTSKDELITIFKQSNIKIIFTEEIFDNLQCTNTTEILDKSHITYESTQIEK